MKWTDSEDIGISLYEKFPAVGWACVRKALMYGITDGLFSAVCANTSHTVSPSNAPRDDVMTESNLSKGRGLADPEGLS